MRSASITTIDEPQERISVEAQRYKLYLQQKSKRLSQISVKILGCFEVMASRLWNKIIPVSIRGSMNQCQKFKLNVSSQTLIKSKLISHSSIEEILEEMTNSVVLIMPYSDKTLVQTAEFLENKKPVLSKFTICPLDVRSLKYINEYQNAFGDASLSLLVARKGLFQELQVLGKIEFTEIDIAQNIDDMLSERCAYEQAVIKYINEETQAQSKITEALETSEKAINSIKIIAK